MERTGGMIMSSYTNSGLVDYIKLSPHMNSPRNHAIDRITPHCYVGQASVESMGAWFANSESQCSCNYGIGFDGRVLLCVEEKNRSWCSSSAQNDNRAVTIECASDVKAPYKINNTVYHKLVELMADICKRNGKKKILWFADRAKSLDYEPKPDEMLITVHRWFANKECPGQFIYDRLDAIAEEVHKKLNENITIMPSPPIQSVDERAKIIWKYFKKVGLNDFAVAGLMGNLKAESALNPINMQDSFEQVLGYNDITYTNDVDNGKYTRFCYDSCGYGLAQWTFWSRKRDLLDFAKSKNVSIGDLNMQLEFLWKELQNYTSIMKVLKNAESVREASNVILFEFEAPADVSITVQDKRASYGQEFYNKFAENTNTDIKPILYRVQVGAFYTKYNAEKRKIELELQGFNPIIKIVDGMYKVQTNAFKIRENAEKELLRLHKLGYEDAFIVTT